MTIELPWQRLPWTHPFLGNGAEARLAMKVYAHSAAGTITQATPEQAVRETLQQPDVRVIEEQAK